MAGRFQIEALLGEGGTAEVYRATDLELERKVAMKVLHGSDRLELLRREARLLAGLKHPALAQVWELIEHEGRPVLVMELLEGHTLHEAVRMARHPIKQRRVLQWSQELLDVLEYLHGQEPPVIVRDLKPENIMLTPTGLKLIDFGIARKLVPGEATSVLVKGLGTEEYAPLEQYGSGSTDQRSDLYSLGATLFFLLTRQAPPPAWKRAAEGAVVPPPGQSNPTVTPALAAVLEQLMALTPAGRPGSVREARELLRLAAIEESGGYRLESTEIPQARTRVRPGSSRVRARTALDLAVPGPPLRDLCFSPTQGLLAVASRAGAGLWDLRKKGWWRTLPGKHWTTLAFSASGHLLAAGGGGTVSVWDLESLKVVLSLNLKELFLAGRVTGLGFLKGGQLLVACESARVRSYDLSGARLVRKFHPEGGSPLSGLLYRNLALAVSSENRLAVGNSSGSVTLWEGGGSVEHTLAHAGPVRALAFSFPGVLLATASPEGVVLWRSATGERLASMPEMAQATSLAFSPDDRMLAATRARVNSVGLWDLTGNRQAAQLAGHSVPPSRLAFAPDKGLLASGDRERLILHQLTW